MAYKETLYDDGALLVIFFLHHKESNLIGLAMQTVFLGVL